MDIFQFSSSASEAEVNIATDLGMWQPSNPGGQLIVQHASTRWYRVPCRHTAMASEQPLSPADGWWCTYSHPKYAWVGTALSYAVTCLILLRCCMQVCMKGKLQPALSIPTTFLWESGQEVSPKAHVANWVICLLRFLHGCHHGATWKLHGTEPRSSPSSGQQGQDFFIAYPHIFQTLFSPRLEKNWLTFSNMAPVFTLRLLETTRLLWHSKGFIFKCASLPWFPWAIPSTALGPDHGGTAPQAAQANKKENKM